MKHSNGSNGLVNSNGHAKSNGHAHSNGHGPAPAMSNGSPRPVVKANVPSRAPVRGNAQFRVPMKTVSREAFRVLASSVARLVDQGKRSIMITSSGPGEGKSTITAALARSLAKSGRLSVAVVDADTVRPRQHDFFQIENRRGLGELLHDVYHVDLGRENPDQFGVGDWIELIRAQSRTGKLEIAEGPEEFSIVFNKGKVSSLVAHPGESSERLGEMLVVQGRISDEQRLSALRVQEEGSHPLGEVLQGLGYLRAGDLDQVLQSQFKSRLHRILTMRQPRYRFSEMVEAYLPAASGSSNGDTNGSGIDRFVVGVAGDYLKQPYLTSQVPGYLKDTAMENLKVLTCGETAYDLCDAHYGSPFEMAVERLAKRFDVVLIDSPPVSFDSATATLAPVVDGVIMVVKSNELNVGIVQQAKEHLTRCGANILGVVLNQVDLFKDEALPYYHSVYR
jgi:Mrp family chromosome partitioning ATPase